MSKTVNDNSRARVIEDKKIQQSSKEKEKRKSKQKRR
jgi:hypothetical protein